MTQVNLLPPEIRQRAVIRRNTFLVGAGGVLLIGMMVLLYFVQVGRLADVNQKIATQDASNTSLKIQADNLREFEKLKVEADAKRAVLTKVYANEVSMSSLLQDVSDVMPSDGFLTSMTVTVSAPGSESASASGLNTFIGQITFAGNAYRLDTFPVWLDRLGSIKGFENPFLNAVTELQPGTLLYQFQSGANLGVDAMTERGKKGSEAVKAGGVVTAP